jgi:hypothetical protein
MMNDPTHGSSQSCLSRVSPRLGGCVHELVEVHRDSPRALRVESFERSLRPQVGLALFTHVMLQWSKHVSIDDSRYVPRNQSDTPGWHFSPRYFAIKTRFNR